MELTIEQALKQGIAAFKEGKIQEAERLYQAILQTQPAHPDANHNLGVLAVSVNKVEAALPFFKTALEAVPVRAIKGGGIPDLSFANFFKFSLRFKYEGLKSCPHSDTQCASSITAKFIKEFSTSALRVLL